MGDLSASLDAAPLQRRMPAPSAVLELMKPITWFPPMWAFGCGLASSGAPLLEHLPQAVLGVVLAGPAVCATSQAVNDWFDRHVDAINEPNRPIPSGRIPGRWGLYLAIAGTILSLALAAVLGRLVFGAAALALVLAWAYSAPPFRLKGRSWWGPIATAFSYEGLSWFTGAALMLDRTPTLPVLLLVLLYSLGAVGIMVLNDFKAVAGDLRCGVRSVPVELGTGNAARLACVVMAAPQVLVLVVLLTVGRPVGAGLVLLSLAAQLVLMRRLLTDPTRLAPWYNATGTLLYVLGMLASGISIGHLGAGA